jgi:tetratricopeptide (TPR) repeat protein
MNRFLSLLLIPVITACSSTGRQEITGVDVSPEIKAEQEAEVSKAEFELQLRNFPKAEELFVQFRKRFGNSIFIQRAQFGLAKSLENQDRWAEAAELYRQTIDATRSRQPEIAAQALYEVSSCYENLGDEARVLASLNDAQALEKYLSPEQAKAEIPAKLAASYNRMGRVRDAKIQLARAEQGLKEVRALKQQDISKEWLAQLYYEMGLLSTNQLSVENLQAYLDTLQMVQIFSYRSMEADGMPWSKMAKEELVANYRDVWNTIQQISMNHAMELGAARREQRERQNLFIGQMMSLIEDIKQYAPADVSQNNTWIDSFFDYLRVLEKQGQEFLMTNGVSTPLTPEAERRGGLRRKGTLVDPDQPKRPAKLPTKSIPSKEIKDPNL